MSQTDKGVLIFFEWFEAMEHLDAKTYKSMMNAIYRYQLKGEKPPEFKGKASIVAAIIFPYIDRRITMSKAGKKGMRSRYDLYGVNPIIDEILINKSESDVTN